jgi:hypothetical protein
MNKTVKQHRYAEVTNAAGQEIAICTIYGQDLRASYNAQTDYRIFIRYFCSETREVEYRLFNSYTDVEAANAGRFALQRDETKYLFVCPGDEDPAQFARGTKREQREMVAADAAQARREEGN